MYYCPNCGEELNYNDKVFVNGNRVVIGCESCIDIEVKDAEDALDDMNDY